MMQMKMMQESTDRKTRAEEREEDRNERVAQMMFERPERAVDRTQLT